MPVGAVEYDPRVPLQILAGPGSGKTKVLTTRIAHLILRCGIPPASICAVTFTKKAANEMKHRLITLIGKESATRVRMGTFHALCALFLRNYARLVGLETNFTICDADESKKMIANFRKKYHSHPESVFLKERTILSSISKAKAKGLSADDLVAKASNSTAHTQELDRIVAEIYHDYESALRSSNCLDFDDLLLFGVRLFTQQPHTADWCNHVLVDEFQDTNSVQYELMKAIAVKQCVTIVGDPDQSIYGWRSAEVGNLARMRRDFPSTQQVLLEENYRSTGGILKASIAIVAQDSARVQKSLRTSHPIGKTPVLCSFPSEQEEAEFCATEIARVVALMGGMLKCGDFAVLLRFNALSRSIEAALQKAGIPSRVLGGHKFFERLEIKDLSAYLQLVDNPDFSPALTRIINVPPRAIGAKTLSELAARGAKTNKSQLAVVEGICDSRLPDISPPVKRKLVSFVKTIRTLRDKVAQGSSPADLLKCLLTSIDYEAHLRKTQPDWESRWENVQELVSFAADDRGNEPSSPSEESTENDTPLRRFLEASMLSSEDDNNKEDSDERVTISTVHAAKGLEWPVVIVPAVEQGTFPFYRTEDKAEERRLLYVACTRAQGLLYLSHAAKRRVAGETKTRDISEFMSALLKENSVS
ncbi:P-loop containing nucleoside triphosphate hydrolase protein [Fistulina hepatica ATCC 64428]|nr:P-loop containing nucleoside triphosphate hydrolase protein [Fistulina hepatica ATCC 64428]